MDTQRSFFVESGRYTTKYLRIRTRQGAGRAGPQVPAHPARQLRSPVRRARAGADVAAAARVRHVRADHAELGRHHRHPALREVVGDDEARHGLAQPHCSRSVSGTRC